METILRAERAGVVAKVNFAPGDSLSVDAAILEFEYSRPLTGSSWTPLGQRPGGSCPR